MRKTKLYSIGIIFAVFILLVYCAIGILLSNAFFNWIPKMANIGSVGIVLIIFITTLTTLVSMLLLLYSGLELYSLRLFVPGIYGSLEICFALLYLLSIIAKGDFIDRTNIVVIFTTLYIVVRGFDNLHRHYKDIESRDQWMKKLLNERLLLARLFGKMSATIDDMDQSKHKSTGIEVQK